MVESAVLHGFAVRNFKSFREAQLTLRPLTVLIGANASGKTNLLEALQLLAWIASGRQLPQILSAIRDEDLSLRGTLPQLTRSEGPIEFECRILGRSDKQKWDLKFWLDLSVDEPLGPRVHFEQLHALNIESSPPLYLAENPSSAGHGLRIEYNNFARGGKKPHIEGSALQPVFTQLTSGARFSANHEKSQRLIPSAARVVAETLQDILVIDPSPRRMRGYSHELDRSLRSDGANVSAVLYALSTGDTRERVLEFVRALPEQDITGIDFLKTPRGEVMVTLEETFGGTTQQREAALLSDGTLRALVIAAAMLSAKPGSTLVIEEVDNGIHPPRVARMLELMQREAVNRGLRLLVTTHNPALLDAIPEAELPHAVACYRDPIEGDSRLVRLGDLGSFPALMAGGSLGALVTRGVLERMLRNPQTDEQRRANALAWLAKLEINS